MVKKKEKKFLSSFTLMLFQTCVIYFLCLKHWEPNNIRAHWLLLYAQKDISSSPQVKYWGRVKWQNCRFVRTIRLRLLSLQKSLENSPTFFRSKTKHLNQLQQKWAQRSVLLPTLTISINIWDFRFKSCKQKKYKLLASVPANSSQRFCTLICMSHTFVREISFNSWCKSLSSPTVAWTKLAKRLV